MPPNPPSKAHGFAMRSMSLCDMQFSKSEKKILGPPPAKSWGRPWRHFMQFNLWPIVLTYCRANARCNNNKFDNRDRNPCAPQRCVSGQDQYPGTGRLR